MVTNDEEVLHTEQKSADTIPTDAAPVADARAFEEYPSAPNTSEIEALLKTTRTSNQGNIQHIIITQEIFEKIKKSLRETIENLEKNPSFLSKAATFWGQLPLWQKILGGVAITVPTLILGIVFNLGFLLAICGVTAIVYTGAGILLNNHHKCSSQVTENLSRGIFGLADLLELTITALDSIRQKLAEEVNKFSIENEHLRQTSELLATQNELLAGELDAATALVASLQVIQATLENTSNHLESKNAALTESLKVSEQDREKTSLAYKSAVQKLDEQTVEFAKQQAELQKNLEEATVLATALQTAFASISAVLIGNQDQRDEFNKRLETFLADKEASFDKVFTRICEAEKKLAETQELFEHTRAKFERLLAQQEEHVKILKAQAKPAQKGALSTLGVFPSKQPQQSETIQENTVHPK